MASPRAHTRRTSVVPLFFFKGEEGRARSRPGEESTELESRDWVLGPPIVLPIAVSFLSPTLVRTDYFVTIEGGEQPGPQTETSRDAVSLGLFRDRHRRRFGVAT